MTSANSRPPARVDPRGAYWPGLIPLRPLDLGEILSAAARLVRMHGRLVIAALIGALVSGGAGWGVLALFADRTPYFSTAWIENVMNGKSAGVPGVVLWPLVTTGILSMTTIAVVSGMAAAYAAVDVIGPGSSIDIGRRMAGRWPPLLAGGLLVGLLVDVGLLVFIVPGLLALAAFAMATPVIVVERATIGDGLRRSAVLTAGFRWRVIGILVLCSLITSVIGTIAGVLVSVPTTLAGDAIMVLVTSLVSAVTIPWTASVVALLYVDLRIRKENLAWTLVRSARAGGQ